MMSAKSMKIGTESLGNRTFNQDRVTLRLQKGGSLLDFAVRGGELLAIYEYDANSDRDDNVFHYVVCEGDCDKPKQTEWVKSISTWGVVAEQLDIIHIFQDNQPA